MASQPEEVKSQNASSTGGSTELQELDTSITALPAAEAPKFQVPDGGLRAWLSVLGGWMVCFCTFGYASSFGVYQDLYTLAGASSASNISWIGSLQLCLMFMLGLVSGKMLDDGYFHHIMFGGSLLYVFSLFMLSLADPTKYYQLILSQGVGMGIGGGLILVPAVSVQAHHWLKRRALAMGIILTGSSCGGIVYPIMLNQLFHGSAGFAWGVRASAFLTLGLLVIANLTMTTRLPSAKQRGGRQPIDIKGVFTDLPYMVAVAGTFLVLWGLFLPYFYLQLYVSLHGLSSNLAFYTLAILNAGSVFGRTLPNLLADMFGQFNLLCPVAVITGGLIFAMYGASSPGGAIVFAILYGFFSGGFVSLVPPTIAVLSRDVNEIGFRVGMGYFLTSFAILTGTPISGALFKDGVWSKPIAFSGAVCLAGSLLLILSRQLYVNKVGTQHT